MLEWRALHIIAFRCPQTVSLASDCVLEHKPGIREASHADLDSLENKSS